MVGSVEVFIATASFALFVAWAWGMFSFKIPDVLIVQIVQTIVIPGWILYIPGVISTIGIIVALYWIL